MEHRRRSTDQALKTPDNQLSSESKRGYEILNSPELRAEYITLTDALISKLVEDRADTAIFLDKSARPVAWLVNELWDSLVPRDADGNPLAKQPAIKFLNIDREQWGAIIGRSEVEVGGINIDRLPEERLRELRSLYAPLVGVSKPDDISLLSGKRVMIVDEVRMSGDTLHMAEGILRKAFPDAEDISGTYWMEGVPKGTGSSTAILGGKVPVWYSDETVKGRLVADRDTTKSSVSASSRQRVGRYWLSTRFRERDESGLQLKREVKQLAADLAEHRLPYIPSPIWKESMEPLETRIRRINDIDALEYIKLRKQAFSKADFITAYSRYMGIASSNIPL